MRVPVTLHRLLLAGTCICVYGTPVPFFQQHAHSSGDRSCVGKCTSTGAPAMSRHIENVHSHSEVVTGRWTDQLANVRAERGAGLDDGGVVPEGIAALTLTESTDSRGEKSGPSKAGDVEGNQEREVETALESSFEVKQTDRQHASEPSTDSEKKADNMEEASVTNMAALTSAGQQEVKMAAVNIPRADPLGTAASPTMSTEPDNQGQREMVDVMKKEPVQEKGPQVEEESRLTLSKLEGALVEPHTSRPAFPELLSSSGWKPRGTSFSVSVMDPILLPSHSSLTSVSQSVWGLQEGATTPALLDPLLPDLGPDLTPRQEGPDSLWTEPLQQSGVDTVAPLSQDVATEGTMSSEDLPLIFDPLDDVTLDGSEAAVTFAPGHFRSPVSVVTRGMAMSEAQPGLLVTVDGESDGQSHASPLPDWTSPWQTSGAEISESINPPGPSAALTPAESKMPEGGIDVGVTQQSEKTPNTPGLVSPSAMLPAMTTVTRAIPLTASKAKSGLEELESEEAPDEDEENENTEDSEEESEEELTETPKPAPTRLPYSLIPPPPVWVQRNQGLMRSWVELIREKAGYVSGMLAPVGIGIAGALLIVGALYSIRMIHRKRKNSFKHQRRKQPREPSINRQDQAMLLADSSEDEF